MTRTGREPRHHTGMELASLGAAGAVRCSRVLQKLVLGVAAVALLSFAADKKALPNQAGNDDVDLAGTVVLDPAEIKQILGAELPPGYVVVRMKVAPKVSRPMRVSADDFILLSRKDGDRSPALSPSQIAGRGAMVVKAAERQPGGLGTTTNGPIWGGIGTGAPRRLPGNGGGLGNGGSVEAGRVDAKIDPENGAAENPLLAVLKSKVLPDTESTKPVEGLLYFTIEGKVKPKDLSLLYKGAGGSLVIDFK